MNTNTHSLKLAVLFLLIGITFSAFGQNKNQASPITMKGYDFRTKGHDSGMYYLARISELEPVVIAVATKDEKFVEAMKKLFREMDDDGYEHITLLFYDLDPKQADQKYSLLFLQNGEVTTAMTGYDGEVWFFIPVKQSKAVTGTKLTMPNGEYPMSIIRTKIRTTCEGSVSSN